MLDDLQLDAITDPYAREVIRRLLNVIETLSSEVEHLRAENLKQRDEINRLKGEQGRPKDPPRPPPTDVSSEAERRVPRGRIRQPKNDQITIDRTERCAVDPSILPDDAVFKGYVPVVVQDLRLQTDNVAFHKAKWYAPSTGRTYLAPLPPGYHGQFGPHLISLIWLLAHVGKMSEPAIRAVVRAAGIRISAGQISRLLLHQPILAAEADAVAEASLVTCPWQQVDHTPTRMKGRDASCHIRTTPVATVAQTLPSTDRLTTLDGLRQQRPRRFGWTAHAEAILATRNLSPRVRRHLDHLPRDQMWDDATLHALLDQHVPTAGPTQRAWIAEAMALAAYQDATDEPVIQLLLTDDAPQFAGLCATQAGCWVHDGRHYTKLRPHVAVHYAVWRAFRSDYWDFYRALRAYQDAPTPAERDRLRARFDTLFTMVTGYDALDARIAKTYAKRAVLLQVLDHPDLPLHTNAAELGCRARVRKRDVSFGPRTVAGARAWDIGLTLVETAKKVGVNIYQYIYDRLCERFTMPSLAECIHQRAQELRLGASWVDA